MARIFLITVFCVFQYSVFGQTSIDEVSGRTFSKIQYETSKKPDFPSNKTLKKIALTQVVSPYFLNIEVETDYHLKLVQTEQRKRVVELKINTISLAENFEYENYNLNRVLLPDIFTMKLLIKGDGYILKQIIFKDTINPQSLFPKKSNYFVELNDRKLNKGISLTISEVEYNYSEKKAQEVERFIESIGLSKSYRQTFANIQNRIEKIDLENVEMLSLYDFELCEIEESLDIYYQRKPWESLPLSTNRAEEMKNAFIGVVELIANTRQALDKSLTMLDKLFYRKGLEYYGKNNNKANYYFYKSIEENGFFTPAYYMQAKIQFDKHNIDSAHKLVEEALANTWPDFESKKQLIHLNNVIYQYRINTAKEHIQNQDYNYAIAELNLADSFCLVATGVSCDKSTEVLRKQAKTGLYHSFIAVAKRALQTKSLPLSELYVMKTVHFRKENTGFINDPLPSEKLLLELINLTLEVSETENRHQNFRKSLEYIEKASEYCGHLTVLSCPDNAKKNIALIKNGIYYEMIIEVQDLLEKGSFVLANEKIREAKDYMNENNLTLPGSIHPDTLLVHVFRVKISTIIETADQLYRKKEYHNAKMQYENALELSNKYGFNIQELTEKMKNNNRQIILKMLQNASIEIWSNDLEASEKILQQAEKLQLESHLTEDPIIEEKKASLLNSADQKRCPLLRAQFKNIVGKAFEYAGNDYYLSARESLLQAEKLANDNKDCHLFSDTLSKYIELWEPAAFYQKSIALAKDLVAMGQYVEGFDMFSTAENYFNERVQQQFPEIGENFPAYISNIREIEILEAALAYQIKNKKGAEGLETLKRLKIYTPENQYEQEQIDAGVLVATDDFRENPAGKPKQLIQKYQTSDDWFLPFNKSYISTFKSFY